MTEDQFFEDKPQSNIVVQIVHRYLPFWPVLIIFLAIAMSVSFVYLRAQIKMYVATARVLLKDPQKGGGDSKVLDALNIFSEKKIVENEIIVLKSNSLLQKVVKELHIYATLFNEGKIQTEELYGENAPLSFIAVNVDSAINYAGKKWLSINWKTRSIQLDNAAPVKFTDFVEVNGTLYKIVVNENYNQKVIGKKYYVVFNSLAGAAGSIGLNANANSSGSTVLNLTIETPVPERGIKILNKLFEVYNIAGIKDKNEIAERTLKFVDERLAKVTADLDSVERTEAAIRAKEGITDITTQGAEYAATIKELDGKKTAVDIQLDILNAVDGYIKSKATRRGTVPSLQMVSDPLLSSLLQQLYQAEFEAENAKAIAGEKSETVLLAEERIKKIRYDVKENLNNIRSNTEIELGSINNQISKNSGMLAQLPSKERALIAITRQQAIKNNIYTFLLSKREETAISSASTSADLRVLENGSSYGPVKPNPKNYYMVGLICGLLAFLIYVQIGEPLSNKILFRTDIEKKTKVPIIGEIIQAKDKNIIAISEGKRTVIAEQFRALRTNLSFMGMSEKNKTLLVTSSVSGEGKSFIATNLALSLTLTGKRVALLEMDLRKPKLSKELGIKRDPGISSYLIGKAALSDIIKPTAHNNLFLVTAGPIPPNPTELVGKPNFAEMITLLENQFDYLIIDSAPIGPVTDSQLLNKFAQTTVYVVRHAVTPSVFLKMLEGLYKEKKFNNMCVVFNGVKPRGSSILNYGFGGYGNGYGYGYGYGSEASGYYNNEGGLPGYKNLFGFVNFIKKLFLRKR